jgi:predicted tellurium resistance membrane protein TerC
VLGLLISIPLVIFSSTLLMKLMDHWPIIVTIGAALLGGRRGDGGQGSLGAGLA